MIADNQLALTGGDWDRDLLSSEVLELEAMNFDLSLLGFESDELGKILLGDEAEAPATR